MTENGVDRYEQSCLRKEALSLDAFREILGVCGRWL